MRKPSTDEQNVQPTDVLCDFCHREWDPDEPMLEGHQGSCICGKCLRTAYVDVVLNDNNSAGEDYQCTMCLEASEDRRALDRAGEPGWRSPMYDDACVCKRCIELAAKALHKDKTYEWTKPEKN